MSFKEYVERRDIINEADMPPPSPPAIVRQVEQDAGEALFKQVFADNLEKFNGDIEKAINYAAGWQPKEKDGRGFVKALKAAAKKHGVPLQLAIYLRKYALPEKF